MKKFEYDEPYSSRSLYRDKRNLVYWPFVGLSNGHSLLSINRQVSYLLDKFSNPIEFAFIYKSIKVLNQITGSRSKLSKFDVNISLRIHIIDHWCMLHLFSLAPDCKEHVGA